MNECGFFLNVNLVCLILFERNLLRLPGSAILVWVVEAIPRKLKLQAMKMKKVRVELMVGCGWGMNSSNGNDKDDGSSSSFSFWTTALVSS
ncbi:hypothetical protein RJT34_13280 [Clitoria ternatea]|uniref:Uncharacterized protein n=1 Tax=Clitoria ternatea TaxID=43366 RepID=A0AAN9JR92_CLITE